MKTIDIFYQAEGFREFEHIEVDAGQNFAALKAILVEKHGFDAGILLFFEDSDDPIDELLRLIDHHKHSGGKIHIHRCRHVEVTVKFNNERVKHRFGPATTIARVRHWAAVKKFGMTPEEAGEHVLQISGTHDRPKSGTHLGSLASCPKCHLDFDLVPDERVNGCPAADGVQ